MKRLFVLLLFFAPLAHAQEKGCDESLWKHVYHAERLFTVESCHAVTGYIVDATKDQKKHRKDGMRHEADGDTHGWLHVDAGQQGRVLNNINITAQGGNLVFEVVCAYKTTQEDAKAACKDYRSTIKIPPVGSHVRILGALVQDVKHGGWMEIHPVTSIEVIP